MTAPNVLGLFSDLVDPRVERTRKHKLIDIVMLVLCTTIVGCKGWDEMWETAEDGEEYFREFLELPNGIPCADTFRRVMTALEPKGLLACLMRFSAHLSGAMAGKHVALDGKTVRGSFAGEAGHGALHVVSAWATEERLVLGQVATDVKSNEITAIPELLAMLDLRGATVTIDAMGCQRRIAESIVDGGADYVFGLKGNQPTLQAEVTQAFDADTCATLKDEAGGFHESVDKGHGRLEVRRTWVLKDIDWLTRSNAFPHLASIIVVESERTLSGNTACERRVYVSSRTATAEVFAALIRAHWSIENQLHWVLDVTFGEDAARIHRKNGAENLGILRKIALTLLQNENSPRKNGKVRKLSIAMKRRLAGLAWGRYLHKVLCAGLGPAPENQAD